MDMLEKIMESAEKHDWQTYVDDSSKEICVEFRQYSPAGEDFSFCVWAQNVKDLPQKIMECYEDFDPEEHAAMWYGARRGEPSSLRALLEDADRIDEMLRTLAIDIYQTCGDISQ